MTEMENNGSNEKNFVVTQICLKKELVQFSEKKCFEQFSWKSLLSFIDMKDVMAYFLF